MTENRKTTKVSRTVKIERLRKIISLIVAIVFLTSSLAWLGYACGHKETTDAEEAMAEGENGGNQNNPGTEGEPEDIEKENEEEPLENEENGQDEEEESGFIVPEIDLEKIKPNESGKIMIVMFHNFVEEFTPTKYDNGEYTMTFQAFKELLRNLYDNDYRLVSLRDYIDNNISVPAGCVPIVFTFDDGTQGQFNLMEEGGKFRASKHSAVGIMEEFYDQYPDFGLEGTFFVNLGLSTFSGKGTLSERLQYLVDKGFEIGNHTLTHADLAQIKNSDALIKEIGGNQKKMEELVPGYKMFSFSLPYGIPSKELARHIVKGEYEGISYENLAILEVGWDPALSPVSENLDLLSIHRVRAPGIEPVKFDLEWWLDNLSRKDEYVSDGNPNTITIPKSRKDSIKNSQLGDKEIIIYGE